MRLIGLVAAILTIVVAGATTAHSSSAQAVTQPAAPFLSNHRIVSFYGTPLAPGLGVLGQGSPAEVVARLREQADAYAALDPERPVQPALHLIDALAQAAPGADGLYLGRLSDAIVEEYIALARANGLLLFLDIQMGRSTIADEVGNVARFLFRDSMLPDKAAIEPYDGVELVIDMDGFGPPAAKLATYDAVITRDAVPYPGAKLFYEHDVPLMSPADVMALLPRPVVVIYQ